MNRFLAFDCTTLEESRLDIGALCRELDFHDRTAWHGENESQFSDDKILRMPSLHILVEATRGHRAVPPVALWNPTPFGGDAA